MIIKKFKSFLAILLIFNLFFTSFLETVLAKTISQEGKIFDETLPENSLDNFEETTTGKDDYTETTNEENKGNNKNEVDDIYVENEDLPYNENINNIDNVPKDVSNLLTDFKSRVFQSNVEVKEGGILDFEKNIELRVSFKAPTIGDYPKPPEVVNPGDYAIIPVPEGLRIINETDTPVNVGSDNLGILKLRGNTITFVFSDIVSNIEINNLTVNIKVNLQYNLNGDLASPGNHEITIFDKKFVVVVPEKEPDILGEKTNNLDIPNKVVNWKVKVEARFDNGLEGELSNYIFEDNLSNVGEYLEDSFKVNSIDNINSASTPTTGFTFVDNTLKYSFQKEYGNTQYLYFQTKIPNEKLYVSSSTITNIAEIKRDNVVKETFESSVNLSLNWLEKNGKLQIQPEGRFIEWVITLNKPKVNFDSLSVQDILANELEWVSAKWQKNEDNNWINVEEIVEEPIDKVYTISNVTDEVRLVLKTKVKDDVTDIGEKNISNIATLKWPSGITEPPIEARNTVKVGTNPLEKTAGGYRTDTREITWRVNFKNENANYGEVIRLVDIIMHKNTSLDDATIEGFNIEGITQEEIFKLRPANHQKYIDNSFIFKKGAVETGAELKTFKIMKNEEHIGDILVITGADGGSIGNGSDLSFEYKTLLTDPMKYAINGRSSVENNIYIYDNNIKVFETKANQSITSQIIDKDMIAPNHSKAIEEDFSNLNAVNSNSSASFDYKNKEATFRIHINNNSTDLTELGRFTIQDLMPNSWVMTPIGEEPFLLYEGVKGSGKSVRATRYIPKEEYQTFLTYSESNNVIDFNFTNIDKSYLIILKGKPTEEKILQYFNTTGKTFREQNHALLYNDNLEPPKKGTGKLTDWEDFSFTSNLLKKRVDTSTKGKGYLTWNIEYKPYELERSNIRLKDEIPYGIELLRDVNWNIIYGGEKGIVLQEMILNQNGSYSLEDVVPNVQDYVTYDEYERDLILNFPDITKGYKLTYRTEIVGQPGEIKNKVTLEGVDIKLPTNEVKYIISEDDASGSIKRGANFFVTVKDIEGNLIRNSEVTLFSKGNKPLRQYITDENGKLRFVAIPKGEYVLKQTSVSNNYVLNKNPISIKVVEDITGRISIFVNDKLIPSDGVEIINESLANVGNLKVTKQVINPYFDLDLNKPFEFTLNLNNENNYSYKIYDSLEVIKSGTIKNNDKFLLSNNQYILIENIPKDTTYNIVENFYPDYNTEYENNNSSIVAQNTKEVIVRNISNIEPGTLVISTRLDGNITDKDLDRLFDFKITFPNLYNTFDYTIVRANVGNIERGNIDSNSFNFKLANNDTTYISNLPLNIKYEVENLENSNEFEVISKNEKGTIENSNKNPIVEFINKKVQIGESTNTENMTESTSTESMTESTSTESMTESTSTESMTEAIINKDEVLEIINNPDGTITEIRKYKNGNIITIIKDKNGNIIEKSEIKVDSNGNVTDIKTDKEGTKIETIKGKDGNIKVKFINDKGNILTFNTKIQFDSIEIKKDKNGNFVEILLKDENGNILQKLVKGYFEEDKGLNGKKIKSSLSNDNKVVDDFNVNIPKTGDKFNLKYYIKNILFFSLLLILLFIYKKKYLIK